METALDGFWPGSVCRQLILTLPVELAGNGIAGLEIGARMNPALWGAFSALGLGTADFMARFSSRAIGHASALLGMLITGCVILSVWIALTDTPLVWTSAGWYLIAITGVATTVMTLLLYKGLARGPISVVAPIVASHPVLVVALAFLFGARPTLLQWIAMALTIFGVVVVARSASDDNPNEPRTDHAELRTTVWIAIGSMVAYAVLVFAGQRAVPVYGELQTLWMSRVTSLAVLIFFMAAAKQKPCLPVRIWPFLVVQGTLDAGGYLALFAGSAGEGAEVAAVVASTFGVVTVLLARAILKEKVNTAQWAGIALIFTCVAVLSY